MTPTLDDGLRALREATELARGIRIELTDEYLRRIELVEALPENRSGSEKGSRWRGNPRSWDLARHGRFVRRS